MLILHLTRDALNQNPHFNKIHGDVFATKFEKYGFIVVIFVLLPFWTSPALYSEETLWGCAEWLLSVSLPAACLPSLGTDDGP